MLNRFAGESRAIVSEAERLAHRAGDATVDPEHLLLALTVASETAAGQALEAAGLDADGVRDAIARDRAAVLNAVGVSISGVGSRRPPAPSGRTRFSPAAKRALEESLRAAVERGDHRIGSAHLLLGVLRSDTSRAPKLLAGSGVDLDDLVARLGNARTA